MGNYFSSEFKPKHKYGFKKSKTINPLHKFVKFQLHPNGSNIRSVDLRTICPNVYDQGQLGSCTANSICGAYEILQIKQKELNPFEPSRLFVYYNEREKEGHINEDSGAEICDGIESINKIGLCPETMWPYDISKFTEKPSDNCYNDAKLHRSVKYFKMENTSEQLKQCLINGYPFVFGFEVYESFESDEVAKTGMMPMPNINTEQLLGGHAVCCVGYDDDKKCFIVRNSWGPNWGDKGYFYMPYAYMTNSDRCSDFWYITLVEDDE